jgi:long-chain acyl-CoA synthetase
MALAGNSTGLVNESDVYISYLPLAHSMEVCLQMTIIISGAAIGFYSGDVRKLVTEDLPALQPTIMAGHHGT